MCVCVNINMNITKVCIYIRYVIIYITCDSNIIDVNMMCVSVSVCVHLVVCMQIFVVCMFVVSTLAAHIMNGCHY